MQDTQTNAEQSLLWNGISGQGWIEEQALLDRIFKPFETLLVEAVSTRSATRVLDVGCGTGTTTLAIARLLDAKGRCVGVDISAPMIAIASTRAESEGATAEFVVADAQTHTFTPAGADMIVSRFGVMFFEDPVAAFANLRRAATADAALHFFAWRGRAENPFMTTAERAAKSLLPDIPAREPDAPGQFAFADPDRVDRILAESGWADIDIRPIDIRCAFPEAQMIRYFTRLGPLARVLRQVDEHTRRDIVETVRAAFDPYVRDREVRFDAACWVVGARSGSTPLETEGAGNV